MRWFKRKSRATELEAVNKALKELYAWATAHADAYQKAALDCEYRSDAERNFAVVAAFNSMRRQIEIKIKDSEKELCM
jgi:hypothetical protein